MRKLLAPALLLLVLGLAASHGSVSPPPSGFVIRPDIADPTCNHGRGVRLPAPVGFVAATLADGSTLVASSAHPRSAVLRSLTRLCAPNHAFGTDGVATIAVPSTLRPKPGSGDSTQVLWISAIAQRRVGGAIVAGSYRGEWLIGEVTARGRMEPAFGTGGWTLLPYHGEISAVVQEPGGRIVVAGDNEGGGCCNRNWAAAVSASGRLETGFGTHGRTELPTGEDSGVELLAREPNGDVLVDVAYGNMGCWGDAIAMLTPSGRPVPGFGKRLDRFWKRLGFGAFVGNAFVDGAGFTLVGTGQQPCADGQHRTTPTTGLIAGFRTDGTFARAIARFPSPLYGSVLGFSDGRDTLVVTWPYADSTRLTLTARRRDGSIDPRFGDHGRATIRSPWRGRDASYASVSVTRAGPAALLVIETDGNESQLTRVRFRFTGSRARPGTSWPR